jgi:hypothetical protein
MYLHLGNESVVKTGEILGIFDLDNTSVSKHTRNYLGKKEKEKKVITVSYELPKSFIVSSDKEETKIYISQLSPSTLTKRIDYLGKNKE